MISLAGTDLDGTFFNNQSQVSAYNRQAVRDWVRSGRDFAVCSGRSLPTVSNLLRQDLEVPGYKVCLNGAIVYDQHDEPIVRRPLDNAVVLAAFHLAKHYLVRMVFFAEHHAVSYKPGVPGRVRGNWHNGETIHISRESELLQMLTVDHVQFYKFTFNGIFGNGLSLALAMKKIAALPVHLSRSNKFFFEANAPHTTKASALHAIARHTGQSMEHFMCFGDYENDLEMVRDVGYGVAMANAIPKIKAVARLQTVDHNDDGVGKMLTAVLAGKIK
ncbi:Cof-type HAD-IIB family hydrolase [Lacticaseibacillus thailandensis]|uniref:HAD superfamily hydrolase n=1 Tax=Lacticaseibacillus thailandensis DSM 22698 = JCM 13996 TaxID=1423810 RepID=A0A0R2C563_9LACO|nr:Cof-type HAD-IIB family hydrolase [Lacticaseibacillus thailandensis]KRM86760.1 HAD superfamily hydrolase [Lacticaseibacillus thailandensis DSM 22698 = JCM 13996]